MRAAEAKRKGALIMATVISMKALLESGVHFGHRTNKWNPRMRPYIFTERNGIHIIDLQQTVKSLNTAYNVVRDTVAGGGIVLFVGTKRQAQETVKEEAIRCGMPYITERWMGGLLTNWVTFFQRIMELDRMEKMRDTGEILRLTKKEGLLIQREIDRLLIRLSGVRNMKKLPDLIFVVDVSREETAIKEANKLEVPVLALVDTNCDPSGVDYVIPSNDDAIRAIKLLVGKVADAVLEGRAFRKEEMTDSMANAPVLSDFGGPRTSLVEEELDDSALLGESTLAKMTPRVVEETPVVKEPPAAKAAPVVKEAAVVVEEATPEVEEAAPVVEEAAPVVEAAAPVIEEAAPVVEEPAAVVEEPAAVVEDAAPAVEEAAAVVDEAPAAKKAPAVKKAAAKKPAAKKEASKADEAPAVTED
jgi:small subunit ribosomal protein S2